MSTKCLIAIVAGLATGLTASAQNIPSTGDLTDGAFHRGNTLGSHSVSNARNWNFFTFTAVQGDRITIEVNRLEGGLDPGSSVVRGDATAITFASLTGDNASNWSGPSLSTVLAFGDDEDPPALPGPFGDPKYTFTAPATSQYTVVVCGVVSNSLTEIFDFEVSVRGSSWGGACCLYDGTCTQLGSAALCTAQNGIYRGDTVTCANGHCACNVLANGGFESGDFTGWTQFGNTRDTLVDPAATHSGHFGADMGPVGTTGGFQQTITAAAGTPLVIDFWYSSVGTPQSLVVDLSGIVLVELTNDETHTSLTEFTIPIIAPVDNPILRFTGRNDPDFIFLDDIRVCTGDGSPVTCYANCDKSTANPILNVNDFQCFLNRFASGCS